MLKAYSSTDLQICLFQSHVLGTQWLFEIKVKLPFFFRLILIMTGNVHFSKRVILQICHLKARGMKDVDIAKKSECRWASIYRILSKGYNFETKLRSGRPKKQLNDNTEIFRLVSTQNWSISREVTVPVSKSTMHRRLQVSKLLNYRKNTLYIKLDKTA